MLSRTLLLPRIPPSLRTRTLCPRLAPPRPRPPPLPSRSRVLTTPHTPRHARFASTSAPPPPPPSRPRSTAYQNAREDHYRNRNRSLLLYSAATVLVVTATSYLAVPLYRVFCSTTGYAGTPQTDQSRFLPERLVARTDLDRRIRVTFNADSSDSLPWSFEPQQRDVRVLPGETALAFYTATNHSDEDIVGIATYNVTPNNIAPYFAKVECFCFEEQRLLAGEEVDLPVFFFIDRDFVDDPNMKDIREVTLSYTFFRARRDSFGNLVPAEGPLAVPNSAPVV
ncbi:cytochrome c oxidase assembly protein COX11 [Rhodotorula diobovata]|uniref:Cytochrome c oxidase assembly protein COX11 n=1 Tax=Rhodotorula diobovata TaxID=5288 RepID=A0A5C5G5S5_9BASI|nr:cytochrome c oxidase assembly protein COX11 [Rhodotorula diobovata]